MSSEASRAEAARIREAHRPPKINSRRMRPTRKHRRAIEPGILGTVYGVNAAGERRYFDYDLRSAYAFAGVTDDPALDARWSRDPNGPPRSKITYLWIKES